MISCFQRTSLHNTLLMLIWLAGGLGLIATSFQPQQGAPGQD